MICLFRSSSTLVYIGSEAEVHFSSFFISQPRSADTINSSRKEAKQNCLFKFTTESSMSVRGILNNWKYNYSREKVK